MVTLDEERCRQCRARIAWVDDKDDRLHIHCTSCDVIWTIDPDDEEEDAADGT